MARFSSVRILVSPQCCQHYRFFGDPSSGKLWYLFGAAAGLFPLGCLVLVIGPQPVLENLFVFPVLQSSASRHIRSQLWKSRLSFFSSHI